ncbi:hypothetical protein RM550_26175 [Streptomyces sp. DSM 41527]|uniref:Uncharacterized protein n=1 Tax=Streptomyces mooreae TaxID=3075523 RepID=A0ABU2TE27_9ACTN|nr:hypothetical protein [Streptomyces sp. DSM 41527]MDT0459162.1 hypothetical protein [Streptomyces sp. DSM 41527]
MSSPLPRRIIGETLAAIVPEEAGPAPVNLFGVPVGESVERRFTPGRLHRIRVVGQDAEPAA